MAEGVLYLGLLVPKLIAIIAGLWIHSFIIGVNVNDWWKGRSVTPVDRIITYLGISRMCIQCSLTLKVLVPNLFLISPYSHVTLAIMGGIYNLSINISFWLTALLSIVFCLKISNLQTRLFLYLRRMIVQRTGYFIVSSVLFSSFSCFMPALMAITNKPHSGTDNITRDNLFTDCYNFNSIYICSVGAFMPLLFYCISAVLLFVSLCHHTTSMKNRNLTINLETYYSVMKFLSFTFIFYTIYFFSYFVSLFYYYFYCVTLPWIHITLDFLSVLHSSYLIYRTAKLRHEMSKVLQNIIDFLFQRNNTKPRENIEVIGQ